MGKGTGILLDENCDFAISVERNSDGLITSGIQVGDVTYQNQQIIVLAEKGEIKENPTMGVGAASYLDDDDPSELLRVIRENLRNDGQTVRASYFDDAGKLIIKGGYGN